MLRQSPGRASARPERRRNYPLLPRQKVGANCPLHRCIWLVQYNTFGANSNTTLSEAAKNILPTPSRLYSKCASERAFLKYKREAPPKCNNLRQLPASKTETGDKPASCTLSGGKTQTRIATRGPGHGSKPTYPCCKTPFEVFSARRWAPTGVKHGPLVCGASVAAAKKTRGEVYP